jgi:hypothetical protein
MIMCVCVAYMYTGGAFLFGMPAFKAGAPPAADPGVKWMLAMADYMVQHKLNTGVVTDGFWQWL